MIILYSALIEPKIDYRSEVYSSSCRTYLDSLTPNLKKCDTHSNRCIQKISNTIAAYRKRTRTFEAVSRYGNINLLYKGKCKIIWEEVNKGYNQLLSCNNRIRKLFITRVNQLIEQYNMQFENLAVEGYQRSPPWRIDNMKICTEICSIQKVKYTHFTLRQIWQEHASQYENTPIFYTDESKSDNLDSSLLHLSENISDRCNKNSRAESHSSSRNSR